MPSTDGRPWSQAWIARLPVAPAWGGVALALAHLASGMLFHLLFVPANEGGSWWTVRQAVVSTLVFALLIGYGAAALAYVRQAHRHAWEELRPVLAAAPEELDRAGAEIERYDATALRTVGLVAALVAAAVTLFTTGLREQLGLRSPELAWVVWQNVLAFWMTSRTAAHELRVSRLLSDYTERFARVDPLDPAPFAPLARRGLQSALLFVLGVSVFSLVYSLDNLSPAVPVLQGGTVVLAAMALVLPSLGVRRRLREARRRELERVRLEIAAAREDPARLAPLLTLRQHLQGAREWPFDLGTLGRFALYAGIGVGSWFGGALVERLLDLFLG